MPLSAPEVRPRSSLMSREEIQAALQLRLSVAGLSRHRVGRVHLRADGIAEAMVLDRAGCIVLIVEFDRRTGAVRGYS